MAFTPFSKSYKGLEGQKKLEFLFPGNSALSYPVIVRREDKLYDGMFAYPHGEKGREETLRPFGWILISMENGRIALLSECRAADFIPTADYPLDSQVSLKLPEKTDPTKVKKLTAELLSVYDELREFAYQENLSREQVQIIVKYKDLFLRLCPKGLYSYYHALAPSFFHWLRFPLPEKIALAKEPEKGDTQEYQYQLLILENLQQLVRQFQEKISVDSHKEKLFDELHREVQEFKAGMLDDLTRHMELDVIRVIEGLGKSVEAFEGQTPDKDMAARLLKLLEGAKTDLIDLLYRQGIDPYTVPGDEVDVSRQTTVSTVTTQDNALDKKVCARLAQGWEKAGKIVRPERISVYIYKP